MIDANCTKHSDECLELICNKCNALKPCSEFGIRTNYKHGHDGMCKPCRRIDTNSRRKLNPEKEAERLAIKRSKYVRKPEKALIPQAVQRETARETERLRYQRKADEIKAAASEWKKNNPHKTAAYKAKRKAQQLNATPAWANYKYIELWYALARMDEQALGVKCHVDHIIPLVHPLVCGLHNEHNLQILTATENCSKQNKWEIE